jgi:hypothetical protein
MAGLAAAFVTRQSFDTCFRNFSLSEIEVIQFAGFRFLARARRKGGLFASPALLGLKSFQTSARSHVEWVEQQTVHQQRKRSSLVAPPLLCLRDLFGF